MTNYQSYIDFLASFADSNSLAVQAETNIYPLFKDIKDLINYYRNTIAKFPAVQSELVNFVERLEFDENDFNYYQDQFMALGKLDDYLIELKNKNLSANLSSEINNFVIEIYATTHTYDVSKNEEQVLAKINYTYDINRKSGCFSVIILFIIAFVILSFTIIKIN